MEDQISIPPGQRSSLQAIFSDHGDLSYGICAKITSYLQAADIGSLAMTSRVSHDLLTMRIPVEGDHPILQGEHKSIMESLYFDAQEKLIDDLANSARKIASRKMKKLLPMFEGSPRLEERLKIRTRYRSLLDKAATLRVKLITLEDNPYITKRERHWHGSEMHSSLRDLSKETSDLAQETRDLLRNLGERKPVNLHHSLRAVSKMCTSMIGSRGY